MFPCDNSNSFTIKIMPHCIHMPFKSYIITAIHHSYLTERDTNIKQEDMKFLKY